MEKYTTYNLPYFHPARWTNIQHTIYLTYFHPVRWTNIKHTIYNIPYFHPARWKNIQHTIYLPSIQLGGQIYNIQYTLLPSSQVDKYTIYNIQINNIKYTIYNIQYTNIQYTIIINQLNFILLIHKIPGWTYLK